MNDMNGSKGQKSLWTSGKPNVRPWLIILLTAPVPALLFLFFFYKWYEQKTDYRKIAEHFIQRQNTILAYDANEVATGVSDLLEKAARDVQVLSLVPTSDESFRKFYLAQGGDFTHFDMNAEATNPAPLLFYNKLLFMKPNGDVAVHYYKGRRDTSLKNLSGCHERDLCDRKLLEKALTLPVGEIEYGNVLRWYTPKGSNEVDDGASLGVAFRAPNGVYLAGIDYRHIKDHMTTPSFPYVPKRNLMQAYENGNYIYIVDSQTNFIAHPKYWHVVGLDRETGEPVAPMINDDDEGKHPLNVLAYREGRLKPYFDRLLKQSFAIKGVDIFPGRNLNGIRRVLSVAPISLEKGQFRHSGVFGHVIVGCALDYFEEPKEKVVPYY